MENYFKISEAAITYLSNKDKKLGAAIKRIGIIKRPTEPLLVRGVIDSIISQQISTKAALTVKERFYTLLSPFTIITILNTDPLLIQKCGLSHRKVSYILAFVNSVNNKEIDLESLHTLPNDEVIKVLTSIKGIGRWTAEMLLIFSLERQDIISDLDLGIIRGLKRLYGHKEISKELFTKYKNRYGMYASVASLYLWELSVF